MTEKTWFRPLDFRRFLRNVLVVFGLVLQIMEFSANPVREKFDISIESLSDSRLIIQVVAALFHMILRAIIFQSGHNKIRRAICDLTFPQKEIRLCNDAISL